MKINPQSRLEIAYSVRFELCARFPAAFAPRDGIKKPLKIGIFHDIRVAAPEIKFFGLKLALKNYCSRRSYLRALIEGAPRIDLDGQPNGFVTKEQADLAKIHLETRDSSFSKSPTDSVTSAAISAAE